MSHMQHNCLILVLVRLKYDTELDSETVPRAELRASAVEWKVAVEDTAIETP